MVGDTPGDPSADDPIGGAATDETEKKLKDLQHLLFIYRVAFYGTFIVIAVTIVTKTPVFNFATILEALGLLDGR